jgi:peroxiredoxin 2/4
MEVAKTYAVLQPGDDIIVPTTGSGGVAKARTEAREDMKCHDWFFCTKKLEKDKVLKTILKK